MVPASHRIVLAEATPTSCVSYSTLREGTPVKGPLNSESGDCHVIFH